MAQTAYTSSGTVNANINMTSTVPITALNAAGRVLTSFSYPLSISPALAYSYSNGTGAGQINTVVVYKGTLAPSQAAASVLDLNSCTDVNGATVTLTGVREIFVFNDGNQAGIVAADDDNILTWDFLLSNAWGPSGGTNGPVIVGSTNTAIRIHSGGFQRFSKPFGANAMLVDGTHKLISLLTPANANTVAYRIIVLGIS